MIASEAQPFSKTGGLADVAAALPKALGRLGHDVTVITPRYRGVDRRPRGRHGGGGGGGASIHARLMRSAPQAWPPGAREGGCCCSIARSSTIATASTTTRGATIPDNAVRYAFLSAAAIDWASQQSQPFDIIHAHDWQGGLAPYYARALAAAQGTARAPYVRVPYGPDDPQSGVSGRLRQDVGSAARPALGRLHDRRLRVLRSTQLSEGRASTSPMPSPR